ncbi:hypothetical protein Tco_0979527 [Tanacetum coccineum]
MLALISSSTLTWIASFLSGARLFFIMCSVLKGFSPIIMVLRIPIMWAQVHAKTSAFAFRRSRNFILVLVRSCLPITIVCSGYLSFTMILSLASTQLSILFLSNNRLCWELDLTMAKLRISVLMKGLSPIVISKGALTDDPAVPISLLLLSCVLVPDTDLCHVHNLYGSGINWYTSPLHRGILLLEKACGIYLPCRGEISSYVSRKLVASVYGGQGRLQRLTIFRSSKSDAAKRRRGVDTNGHSIPIIALEALKAFTFGKNISSTPALSLFGDSSNYTTLSLCLRALGDLVRRIRVVSLAHSGLDSISLSLSYSSLKYSNSVRRSSLCICFLYSLKRDSRTS